MRKTLFLSLGRAPPGPHPPHRRPRATGRVPRPQPLRGQGPVFLIPHGPTRLMYILYSFVRLDLLLTCLRDTFYASIHNMREETDGVAFRRESPPAGPPFSYQDGSRLKLEYLTMPMRLLRLLRPFKLFTSYHPTPLRPTNRTVVLWTYTLTPSCCSDSMQPQLVQSLFWQLGRECHVPTPPYSQSVSLRMQDDPTIVYYERALQRQ